MLIMIVPPAGVAVTRAALAQMTPAQGAEKTADEYANEARELAIKNDFQRAYPLYVEAWKRKKSYDIAGNLAGAELELGKMREAAEHFAFCVQNFPAIRDAALTKKLEAVRKLFQKARANVGVTRIQVTRDDGRSAERAQVFVDGRPVGHVAADGEVEQTLLLSSEVFVDPGVRTFTATYAGCEGTAATLNVETGGAVNVRLLLLCQVKLSIPLLVAGFGVTAAGVGLGIGATVHSNAKSQQAYDMWTALSTTKGRSACRIMADSTRCRELEGAYDDSRVFEAAAISGFVIGGVAAAATVGYVLAWGIRSSSVDGNHRGSSVQARFHITPGGGGAVIFGGF